MIKLAKQSPYRAWMHGCIVYRGGRVVGQATNTFGMHAEVRALKRVKYKHNLTVLSVRVGKDGKLRMAKPCPECWQYLVDNGVRTILYSVDSGEIIRERVS
jgi:pyrimidine deaminase RibD-like protein